ncbi:hypothetical protein CVT26_002617 [Gymnopilus dilepis]|uniref:Uncharacterized protein n=1 Tax=Gymnopilus dilepis TaxID=231916 RepID=A0A409VF72_9AGAR|nr:hypothetical protein CVT26_002617 [Gymnopilus dilepis]
MAMDEVEIGVLGRISESFVCGCQDEGAEASASAVLVGENWEETTSTFATSQGGSSYNILGRIHE